MVGQCANQLGTRETDLFHNPPDIVSNKVMFSAPVDFHQATRVHAVPHGRIKLDARASGARLGITCLYIASGVRSIC